MQKGCGTRQRQHPGGRGSAGSSVPVEKGSWRSQGIRAEWSRAAQGKAANFPRSLRTPRAAGTQAAPDLGWSLQGTAQPPVPPGAPGRVSQGSVFRTPPALQKMQIRGGRTWWREEGLVEREAGLRTPPFQFSPQRPLPLPPPRLLPFIRSCDGSSCCQMQRLLPQKVTSGHLF